MVDPRVLCNKHLLGEHGEIHKHRHNFVKGHKVTGRLTPIIQIEPASMQRRHDELAEEMLRREMNHQSPFEQPDLSKYGSEVLEARVDPECSLRDLRERCEACRLKIDEAGAL